MDDRSLVSSKRVHIMGFAALWVMLFHGTIDLPLRGLATFIKIGYLGVDIFVFMSGFSMWNSFCCSCESNSRLFLKRRLKKIMPVFLPFAVIYLATYYFNEYKSLEEFGASLLTRDFWIFIIFFRWFVPFILFCYFITPGIHSYFSKFEYNPLALGALLLFCVCLCLPFVYIKSSLALMTLLRLPEYVLGWYFAGKKSNRKTHMVYLLAISMVLFFAFYWLLGTYTDEQLSDTGLYWWPISLLIVVVVVFLSKTHIIENEVFEFLGTYSLELYLWHMFFSLSIISFFESNNIIFDDYGVIINLIAIIGVSLFALIYHKVISFFAFMIYKFTPGMKHDQR